MAGRRMRIVSLIQNGLRGMVWRIIGLAILATVAATPVQSAAPSAPQPPTIEELHLLEPFWNSTTVYREGLFFVQESADQAPSARLLFTPGKVLKLSSARGDVLYDEGKDYTIDSPARRIVLTKQSRIPFKQRAELYVPKPANGNWRSGKVHAIPHKVGEPGTWLYFGEGHFYHDQQQEITYERSGPGWDGFAPAVAVEQLPRTLGLLKAHKPLTMCIAGDSISAGGNASRGVPPHMRPFGELVVQALERIYQTKVTWKNLAVGGAGVDHGVQIAPQIVALKPDLVLVAYGMNNVGGRNPAAYQASTRKIIERVRQDCPETEFILVATMLANPEWVHTPAEMFPKYRDALAELCGRGTALADVTALWTDILRRKGYHDLTGNGVNHANDYGHRLYAQVILGLLSPDVALRR